MSARRECDNSKPNCPDPDKFEVETKNKSAIMEELSDDRNTKVQPSYGAAAEIADKIRVDGDDDQGIPLETNRYICCDSGNDQRE